MTNEERKLALYCLKANSDFHKEVCEECDMYPSCDHFIQDSVTEKLIEALEQEPCEAISREALLNGLANIAKAKAKSDAQKALMGRVIFFAEQLPPVQPKYNTSEWCRTCSEYDHEKHCCPKYNNVIRNAVEEMKETNIRTAEWVLLDECSNSGYYCSECHKKLVKEGWSDTVKKIKYCPNCGAKMQEVEDGNK